MAAILVRTSAAEYEVLVKAGLLASLSRRVSKACGNTRRRRIFVLTSPNIWALWSKQFLTAFRDSDDQPTVLFLPAGERFKRLGAIERLAEQMAEAGADRSSILIAFGGGIVGDACGFLAAIYMRGIEYIQVPTTLLAQVDSSVGGKTGVNLAAGKNLVGSFHPPRTVLADIDLLGTLPARELRAGLFESVKAGIIRDRKLFTFMERERDAILARDPRALVRVIAASVRMKAEVVGIDERESGLRMILNFGHTLGHAVEAATRYSVLLHGEAVGWGMLAATRLGLARGTVTEPEATRISNLILAYGPLPTFRLGSTATRPGELKLPALKLATQRLLAAAGRDKKNRAGVRRFVLPKGIGEALVVENLTDAELYSTADWLVATAARVAPAAAVE